MIETDILYQGTGRPKSARTGPGPENPDLEPNRVKSILEYQDCLGLGPNTGKIGPRIPIGLLMIIGWF